MLGLVQAFEGNLQLPAAAIKAKFDAAEYRMLAVNLTGSRLRLAGDVAAWFSFAATAAITLIVGFLGRPAPPANAPVSTEGLPARLARLIGLLAAAAAVLTAFGRLAVAKSQDYYKHADELQALLVRSRAAVVDAKSADQAQAVLTELEIQSQR